MGCCHWSISRIGTATGCRFCGGRKLQQLRHNRKSRRGCPVRCHHRLASDEREKVSAGIVASYGLCAQRKILTHNSQPATLFAATHLGWSNPFAIRHSLLAIRCCFTNRYSPVAIRRSLFAIRYSLSFRLGRSLALPIPSRSRPASHASCPVLSRRSISASSTTD